MAGGGGAPHAAEQRLVARGVRVWRLSGSRNGISPQALLRRLAEEGCHEVLVEGGAEIARSWVEAGVVDRVALFIAPLLLGDGLSWGASGVSFGRLGQAKGKVVSLGRKGGDLFCMVEWGSQH